MKKTAFVTGASGLLGAWLCRELLERGQRVVVLRRDRSSNDLLTLITGSSSVSEVHGDICDGALLRRVIAEYEVNSVYHLAAQTIVGTATHDPVGTFESNIRGTWQLLEAARLVGVEAVVVASSDKAYGSHQRLPYTEQHSLNPLQPYEVSKAATDMIARSYAESFNLPVAVTRCANIYGGGDRNRSRLIPEAVTAVLNGRQPVIRSDGSPQRDFIYVEDAVVAYLALADALTEGDTAVGEAFNIGVGEPYSVLEVVKAVCDAASEEIQPLVLGSGELAGEIDRQWVDPTKFKQLTGWEAKFDLAAGIAQTVEWYRRNPEQLGL